MNNQITRFHVTPAEPYIYDHYASQPNGFSVSEGLELHLKASPDDRLSVDLKYTLSETEGARLPVIVRWYEVGSPWVTVPVDHDQTHDIIGTFILETDRGEGPQLGQVYPFEKLSIGMVVHASSGRAFSLMEVYPEALEVLLNPRLRGGVNTDRLPWTYTIDAKIEKTLTVGEFQLTPFIWVKNLLDRKNVTAAWNCSGKANTTGWLETEDAAEYFESDPEVAELYRLKENDPTHYGPPRQIYLGLRATF